MPLDDLPPFHRELAQDLGLVRGGQLMAPLLCPGCLGMLQASCARCGEPACGECDECGGCGRVVCRGCNEPGTPQFSYPGDVHAHPHNV